MNKAMLRDDKGEVVPPELPEHVRRHLCVIMILRKKPSVGVDVLSNRLSPVHVVNDLVNFNAVDVHTNCTQGSQRGNLPEVGKVTTRFQFIKCELMEGIQLQSEGE
jgi:hypothetical protein